MKDFMTFEEALQDPSLSHYHEIIHFLEEDEDAILFPKKFMMSLKHIIEIDIRKLYKESPSMPLLRVVLTSLEGVNENMTTEMILEITAHILKEWASLKEMTAQKASELQLA